MRTTLREPMMASSDASLQEAEATMLPSITDEKNPYPEIHNPQPRISNATTTIGTHSTNQSPFSESTSPTPHDPHDDDYDTAKAEFIRSSPYSPRNWPAWRKWWVIVGLQFYTFVVFVASTGFVTTEAMEEYGVGEEVSVLGQSMLILGVAVGPMLLAPLSEIYGRQPIYAPSILLFSLLQIPAALSPNFAGLVVTRFLTGCVAGLPISNVGATAADLYPTSHTAWSIMLFSFFSQVGGPDVGPTIGGAIYVGTGTLKWLYWTVLIAGMITFAWSLTFGETLHDKVFEKHTGRKKDKSASSAIAHEITRAFRFLLTEPIVIALALTTTFLFALIFIYLQGYPLVFSDEYDFNPTQEGAMFLVGIGGGLLAVATQPVQNWLYRRSARGTKSGKPKPEARLYTACFAVFTLPISIFWFAFTSTHPEISYQIPMWSGFLFGYAEVAVYTGIWQYVTDAYGTSAASALAACNLPANTIAAALAHASLPMFKNLGNKWALALIAFVSLLFLAVPWGLVWMGPWLRERSRWAVGEREQGARDD